MPEHNTHAIRILFSGGGTLGPVTPLLAIFDTIHSAHPDAVCVWVGTKNGAERVLIEQKGISFQTMPSGKFRRYVSWITFMDAIRVLEGFFYSLFFLWKFRPDICISAGGFVSVPIHWAGWFLGIPTWIHQQDVVVGLSNRLMSPCAKKITTALQSHLTHFPRRKTEWLGNPVRNEMLHGSRDEAMKLFDLKEGVPVVFATGGGTGSLCVNQLVTEAVQHLQDSAQVIHLSGRERPQELVEQAQKHFDFYHTYQFFTEEMKHAYAVADIVISRGGFGTLTELAALGKPAILIPKPGHQEENVRFLADAGAVILVNEATSDGNHLAHVIKDLLRDQTRQRQLGRKLAEMLPVAKGDDVLRVLESVANKRSIQI